MNNQEDRVEEEMQKPVQQFTRWQGSLGMVLMFGFIALIGFFFSDLFAAFILSVGTILGLVLLFVNDPSRIPGNSGRIPAIVLLIGSVLATGYCWMSFAEHPTDIGSDEDTIQIDSVAVGRTLKADSERLFAIEKTEDAIFTEYSDNVNKYIAGRISATDMILSIRKAIDASDRMYRDYGNFKPSEQLPESVQDTISALVDNIETSVTHRRLSMEAFQKVLDSHKPSDMADMKMYKESSQTIITQSGLAFGFLLAQWKAN